MQKFIITALASIAALLVFESNRKKNGSEPFLTDKKPYEVSEEQIRQVMKHLGKRSGKVRSEKV